MILTYPLFSNLTVKLNGILRNIPLINSSIASSISTFLGIQTSTFFLTLNGAIFKEGDITPHNTPFTIHFRARSGSKNTPELAYPTYRPQTLFLDPDGTPSSWFNIFEMRTSSRLHSRVDLLLDSIPNELMAELGVEIVEALNGKTPYENVKVVILKKYLPPPSKRFANFAKPPPYLGSKPSTFLKQAIHDIETTLPGLSTNTEYVSYYFLSALPLNIRNSLRTVDSTDPHRLAAVADNLMEDSYIPTISTCTIDTPSLQQQISALSKTIESMKLSAPNPAHAASTFPIPSSSTLLCHYHRKFNSEAFSCCIGCTWSNPSASLKIVPICVHHNRFGPRATKCLPGCTYTERTTANTNVQKN